MERKSSRVCENLNEKRSTKEEEKRTVNLATGSEKDGTDAREEKNQQRGEANETEL